MTRFLPILLLLVSCGPVQPLENPFDRPDKPDNQNARTTEAGPLRIFILDIGQGDASLVIGPTGKAMLIDGGPTGQGIATILPTLSSLGISHLNWIAASHYDADHIGGIPEVMMGTDQRMGTEDDLIPSEGLIDRGDLTDKNSSTYKNYLQETAPYRKETIPGGQFDLGSGASATVIVVNGHYSDGRIVHLNPDEENEAAIGLLIRYGDFQYFTAGDLTGGGAPGGYETKDMETIAGEIIGDIDVLHVGHHGSATSTNEKFLEEIKPEAAVISVGKENDYGHPTKTVLNRLQNIGAQIYRTDLMGTIEIDTDGINYKIAPR